LCRGFLYPFATPYGTSSLVYGRRTVPKMGIRGAAHRCRLGIGVPTPPATWPANSPPSYEIAATDSFQDHSCSPLRVGNRRRKCSKRSALHAQTEEGTARSTEQVPQRAWRTDARVVEQ